MPELIAGLIGAAAAAILVFFGINQYTLIPLAGTAAAASVAWLRFRARYFLRFLGGTLLSLAMLATLTSVTLEIAGASFFYEFLLFGQTLRIDVPRLGVLFSSAQWPGLAMLYMSGLAVLWLAERDKAAPETEQPSGELRVSLRSDSAIFAPGEDGTGEGLRIRIDGTVRNTSATADITPTEAALRRFGAGGTVTVKDPATGVYLSNSAVPHGQVRQIMMEWEAARMPLFRKLVPSRSVSDELTLKADDARAYGPFDVTVTVRSGSGGT